MTRCLIFYLAALYHFSFIPQIFIKKLPSVRHYVRCWESQPSSRLHSFMVCILYTHTHIHYIYISIVIYRKGGSAGKESALQCRRSGFNPWVGKIPWRREWLPTPVFLPGEFNGQRTLAGCSPWGHKELDTTERLTLSLLCTILSDSHVPIFFLSTYPCFIGFKILFIEV